MAVHSLRPAPGLRLHQFVVGAIPVGAYLVGSHRPIWVAVFLSLAAMLSIRLIVVARLWHYLRPASAGGEKSFFHLGVHRFDEACRAILLGLGLALLLTHHPIGWLPVLSAAAISVLAGATGFSFTTVFYAFIMATIRRLGLRRKPAAEMVGGRSGNPLCVVCRFVEAAPYHRCTWCSLTSVRSCCGIQTSMLLALLLVIAFLLTSTLEPMVTKVLVTMSILGVVALALTITRQTDDLVETLEGLNEEHLRAVRRCELLKRLAMAESAKAVAEEAVAYIESATGARRISVMVATDDVLRIAASRGIPEAIARAVEVPIGERICGRVFATGHPSVLRNILSDRPHEALGIQDGGEVASYPLATAGMNAAGHKVGVINATDKPGGEFAPADLAELEFLGEAVAISLSSQLAGRDLELANFAALRTLALAMEAKDTYTNGHSLRVQSWALSVGKEFGMAGQELETLSRAAELHDIGKLAVPDSILQANRRLTDDEWVVMREHPRRGVQMIQHLKFLQACQPAILHHHERPDGKGYPDGLVGDAIPLPARILAVIDAYDAMTSARAYRPAMAHEKAADELRHHAAAQFDPRVVETFLRLLGDEVNAAVGVPTEATTVTAV